MHDDARMARWRHIARIRRNKPPNAYNCETIGWCRDIMLDRTNPMMYASCATARRLYVRASLYPTEKLK